MTITINLPSATEEALRAQADATGKNITTLVVEAVEARLALGQLRFKDILAPVHADFRQSGMTEAELTMLLERALENARCERRSDSGSVV